MSSPTLVRLLSLVKALFRGGLVQPGDDAVAIVEERKTHRGDAGDEDHRVDVPLLRDVGAEIRRDPRPGQASHRRHDREDPERDRADAEEIRDDVLRKSRDQIQDEADDGALGLEDEVHPVPVVLAEPRPDQRLAPAAPDPEAEQRPDRQADRRIDHPPHPPPPPAPPPPPPPPPPP